MLGEPRFKLDFQESGLWGNDEGTLLIVDAEDSILGHVEYFRTVSYLDELELGISSTRRSMPARALPRRPCS